MLNIFRNYLRDYTSNHRNAANRAFHVLGVPFAPWGGLYLLIRGRMAVALVALVVGYGLQWIGHRIEGNQMGDLMLIKQLVGHALRGRQS
jgi:hypothetical protein